MMGLLGAQRFTLMAKLAGGSRLEETKAEKAQLDAESAAKRSRRLRVQRRRLRSGRGGGQSATAEVSAVAEPEQSITTRELLIGRLGLFDTKADLIAFDVLYRRRRRRGVGRQTASISLVLTSAGRKKATGVVRRRHSTWQVRWTASKM